jgi:hypothetical protein
MQLIVRSGGAVRCVYGEELSLCELGALTIQRGSHVEPTGNGLWTSNMSPVNGPLLGPFSQRSEALKAERQWLERYWL